MQSNFDATFMTILCKMITKLLSHFFHRYCFFTGPLTNYVQTLDMKRHPDFLRTFNSFLFQNSFLFLFQLSFRCELSPRSESIKNRCYAHYRLKIDVTPIITRRMQHQRRLVTLLNYYRTHIADDVSTYSFART